MNFKHSTPASNKTKLKKPPVFPDAHIKVMCGRDYIAIRAVEDFFKYHNVPLESLHLTNKSCRAQREVINNVPYYISRISKSKYVTCGGKPLEVELHYYLCTSTAHGEYISCKGLLSAVNFRFSLQYTSTNQCQCCSLLSIALFGVCFFFAVFSFFPSYRKTLLTSHIR